ncbi:diguanylate cyclase [Pseudomonas duriflava]|uniref:diguanylate cyclase n=1 Tax=Pseudomonas duriflava TaxID=459528 RepID=A0A562QA17_9PSED|nr:sensor domain-containing diguanylate cyclase [Pseudomonas duriflava]TWI53010.1 diguanylate cyclase [Pseudomonas duriflava]
MRTNLLALLTRKRLPAQHLALSFVVLVCLAILGLDIWQTMTARAQRLQEGEVNVSNLTRAIAQHAEDTIAEADTVIAGIVERVEWDGLEALNRERLERWMRSRVEAHVQLHGLFVYDAQGTWLATSYDTVPVHVNNSDREYFIYHRDHPDATVRIGAVVKSRTTGDLVIPVTRRMNHPDGRFAGVVLATIRVDYFNTFYRELGIGSDGALLLALKDGTVLVRRPFDEAVIGTSEAKGRIFNEFLPKSDSGTAMLVSIVDQVERLYGYRQLHRYPLVIEAGLSKQVVLASWQQGVYRSALVVLVVMIIMGLFGLLLIRQIQHGLDAEKALQKAHDALEKMALHDGLTGLANRRQLEVMLPAEIGRAYRNASSLALIMIDIDHFKRYNDLYGHPAGDECIKAVSEAVKDTVRRAGDLAVRYGGEEILILLPGTDEVGAYTVAEKILTTVRGLAIEHKGNQAGIVTISAGVHACLPRREHVTPQRMIKAADEALYIAKASGRNKVHSHFLNKIRSLLFSSVA